MATYVKSTDNKKAFTAALTAMRKKNTEDPTNGCEVNVTGGSALYTNSMYDIHQIVTNAQNLGVDCGDIESALAVSDDNPMIFGCYMAYYDSTKGYCITTEGASLNNLIVDGNIKISGARNSGGKTQAEGLSMCILTSDDANTSDPAYQAYVENCVSPATKALYNALLK